MQKHNKKIKNNACNGGACEYFKHDEFNTNIIEIVVKVRFQRDIDCYLAAVFKLLTIYSDLIFILLS